MVDEPAISDLIEFNGFINVKTNDFKTWLNTKGMRRQELVIESVETPITGMIIDINRLSDNQIEHLNIRKTYTVISLEAKTRTLIIPEEHIVKRL